MIPSTTLVYPGSHTVVLATLGMAVIANALKTNTHLKTLSLKYAKIDDEGTEVLADGLAYNRTLRDLNLYKCQVQAYLHPCLSCRHTVREGGKGAGTMPASSILSWPPFCFPSHLPEPSRHLTISVLVALSIADWRCWDHRACHELNRW